MTRPEAITLVDVSIRDGLQDEAVFVATDEKANVARALVDAGVTHVEATSFVHPRWVPQLADADALVPKLPHGPRYSALVLNRRGFERAVEAFDRAGWTPGTYDLAYVTSTSPRHAAANNNRTIDETLAIFDEVASAARERGVALRATIACAFVSPWHDETIDEDDVLRAFETFVHGGARIITLADTVGRADPRTVAKRIDAVRAVSRDVPLALHLHDSFGYALANIYAGLEAGVRVFEAALAGLGGCPFAPDAPGNLDLQKLAKFVEDCGFATGIDREKLARAAACIRRAVVEGTPIERAANAAVHA